MSDTSVTVSEHQTGSIPGPVFVVGMNGSGTTLLADCLGRHPDLYMFPHEVRLLPYVLQQAPQWGDPADMAVRRRIARELCAAKPFWQVNGRRVPQIPDECLTVPTVAGVIDAVFRHFSGREGKPVWGEKSPMNVLHIAALGAAFPDARFVHIVRDGRDAAQSFHRRFGFVPEETVYRWKRAVSEGQRQGAAIGRDRYLELRYEDFTADPEPMLRSLSGFLGLRYDPAMLQASMRMANPSLAAGGPRIAPNSGRWSSYFDAQAAQRLERIGGCKLSELGYPVDRAGDEDPGLLTLRWWRIRGIAARVAIQFRRYGPRSVFAFARAAGVSLKQMRSGGS